MLLHTNDMSKLITKYSQGKNVFPSSNTEDIIRKKESRFRKQIINLYHQLDTNEPNYLLVYKSLLYSESKYVRMAALDVIKRFKKTSSLKTLFQALEEEDDSTLRESIVEAIEVLTPTTSLSSYESSS